VYKQAILLMTEVSVLNCRLLILNHSCYMTTMHAWTLYSV